MISLKDDSINPRGLTPECLLGIMITASVLQTYKSDLVITSLNDGKHKVNSSHYSGNAWDVRVWYIEGKEEEVCKKLQAALGRHYDVIFETDHIHIQYKPKRED